MQISRNLAYQIVNNIKDIINQDLNFMNKDGIIIASTDPNRVNSYHQAAKVCVDTKRVVVIDYDEQFVGAKKGVNVPVEFDNEIIGVIGITGEHAIVEKYVNIIKKMTEILLKEEWINQNQVKRRDNNRIIIENILFGEYDNFKALSIDDSSTKYIALSKPINEINQNKQMENILLILDSFFYDDNNVFYSFIFQELIILFTKSDYPTIKSLLEEVNKSYYSKYKKNINFGLSNGFKKFTDSKEYYKQAYSSFIWKNQNYKNLGNVLQYDELDVGMLLSNVSNNVRIEYHNKILKNLDANEYDFYKTLIEIYGQENASITKIADRLFMHKNSIQYRLNRLHTLTGYNPRELEGYMILRLAFLLGD